MKIMITSTTTDDLELAQKISTELVAGKIIACAQINEIQSLYSWKDEIRNEKEYEIRLKHPITDKNLVYDNLRKMHNYDLPEIISYLVETTKEYHDWVVESCN